MFFMVLAPGAATTLLTNGSPVDFILPALPANRLLNGEFGYAIYVPPGATRLRVLYLPQNVNHMVTVLVRHEFDVGFGGGGSIATDFFSTPLGAGIQEVVVTEFTSPRLRPGMYFIGFILLTANTQIYSTLLAEVEGGSIQPVRTVAISNFEEGLDGWVANTSPSSLPGATTGQSGSRIEWRSTGGRPGGFAAHQEEPGPGEDAYIAPTKFLGNLATLPDPRFEFDLKPLEGPGPDRVVEIRIFGAASAFAWNNSAPPAPPDDPACRIYPLNPPPEDCRWRHYTAALTSAQWARIAGEAPFGRVLSNVERVEIRTDLSFPFTPESTGLDNFGLFSRGAGPAPLVLAGNTSFASGGDGWTRNFPAVDLGGATTGDANSTFRWVPVEGNPGGYLRITDAGGPNRDYAVGPIRFLGNYGSIEDPQIEFDYLHSSLGGATLPVEARLIGAGSVYAWTGAVPGRIWTRYVARLIETDWRLLSGSATLNQVLANVERVEISADQAAGPESNSIDNFWLRSASAAPAPAALSANPAALSFVALAGGTNPAPQPIGVTAMGGGPEVSFTASTTTGSGNWLRVSAERGTTPLMLNAVVDAAGLREGSYIGLIRVNAVGQAIPSPAVTVILTVNARSGVPPRVNAGGAVNAANGRAPLAPGGLGTLYGQGLGPAIGAVASFLPAAPVLPTRLAGVRLLLSDVTGAPIAEAPLLYASDRQINFQLPFETQGHAEVWLVVDNDGVRSEPHLLSVVGSAPGIFTWAGNRAVAVNEDNSVNTAGNPAWRGSFLTLYMTGQGNVTPPLPTGAAASERTLSRYPGSAQAWIGGTPARLTFVGLTPGLVGVLQINLVVPDGAPAGETSVIVNLGGWTSNSATLSVR